MYICYVDESGHCGTKYNQNQPVEVLCGVQTDVSKLFKTQRELRFLKRYLEKFGVSLDELKASEIYRGRKHWSGVRPHHRRRLFTHLLRWAASRTCTYFVAPIDSAKFFDRLANGCPISGSFRTPFTAGAVNILLGLQRAHSGSKNNKGKTLLIFDDQTGLERDFFDVLGGDLEFTDKYTGFKPKPRRKHPPERLEEIVDVPHFSKSHLSALIQVADIAAFVVAKYLLLTAYGRAEAYAGELAVIEGWYRLIGERAISHTMVNPPAKDALCNFFREVRPDAWSAKKWFVP